MLKKIMENMEKKVRETLIYPSEEIQSQPLIKRLEKANRTTNSLVPYSYEYNTKLETNFKKYSSKLANAIEELAPVFEEKFKNQYPDLKIKEELINLCTSSQFNTNDLEAEANEIEQLQWCAALWLKKYITETHKKSKLQEILNIPNNVKGVSFPNTMTYETGMDDETSFQVDQIMAERNGIKSIFTCPVTITDNLIKGEDLPNTPESEKFQELLYLVDDKIIYELKNAFLENLFKIFELYLEIKQEKLNLIKNSGQQVNVELGVFTPEIGQSLFVLINFQLLYTIDNHKFECNSLILRNENDKDYIKKAKATTENANALETAFIAFYMLQTNDSLFWLYPLSRCLLHSINDKLPMPPASTSVFPYANPEQYLFFTNIKNKIKIECPNPEAPLDEIKLRYYFKKSKPDFKTFMNLNQYIYSLTGIIDSFSPKQETETHQKMLMEAGLNQEKAQFISYLTSATNLIGDKIELLRDNYINKQLEANEQKKINTEPNHEAELKKLQKKLNETQKQSDIKTKEIQRLKKQIETSKQSSNAKFQKEINYYKDKSDRLESKVNDLKTIMKKQSQEKAKELANEFLMEMIDKQLENEERKSAISFPIILDRKITVFGGHESWVKQIQQLLPNVTFYPKDKNPDEQLIRNSDAIWIQENAICHSFYHKVADIVKAQGKVQDFNFFNCSSAQTCAEKIVYAETLQERK